MKKALISLFSILLLTSFSGINSNSTATSSSNDTVYVCSGPYAKKYHKTKTCRGLNNCSGDIKEVKKEVAKKTKSSCGICYKNGK